MLMAPMLSGVTVNGHAVLPTHYTVFFDEINKSESESESSFRSGLLSADFSVRPGMTEQQLWSKGINKTVNAFFVLKSDKSRLVKVGSAGFIGLRRVHISPQNDRIIWDSFTKSDASIPLEEIDEIVLGQSCDNFHLRHIPRDLALVSFSLIYENGHKSLDLVAPTLEEYEIWTEGLTQIIKRIKAEKAGMVQIGQRPVSELRELNIVVPLIREADHKDISTSVQFYLNTNMLN